MNLTKIFDIVFALGVGVWILFAWVLPAVFNADSDVSMWLFFLVIGLCIYAVGRVIAKFLSKVLEQ